MRFVYALVLVFVVGVSVSLAESLRPMVNPPAGYSSCSVSNWSPPNFSGTCTKAASRARSVKNNPSLSGFGIGGSCLNAGKDPSRCPASDGCKWFSAEGRTRNGKPLSPREIEMESFCDDNCHGQPLEMCSEIPGCVIGQKLGLRIVNSYHPQSMSKAAVYSGDGIFQKPQKECMRASSIAPVSNRMGN